MRRLLLDKLIQWKNLTQRKPILIDGARQTGNDELHRVKGTGTAKNRVYADGLY